MARIQVIDHSEATGELKKIYDDLVNKRGKLAEVHKIQSLNPATIVHHMDLYMSIMYAKSPLNRAQREMMAVVVSAANNCEYCQIHHKQALQHYWKDEERVNTLAKDYTAIGLEEPDQVLCDLAYHLTAAPSGEQVEQAIDRLKQLGHDDRAILDAHLVIAYFNFVNRLVLGLGVALESDQGEGYKY
ncbi:peroxidase-related enzyme [Pontibacter sp. FD36]|uniref:peroxidase-related enzyme n=1 Tax=Pontibacter sp. FD36 TaxID=2789860 RepID=UPI0018A8F939|nr:peroxidase-related enzyme [Pontibacter sp. FD36]MBF8965499.1 peroxidase-related enzyme [Pontibacter sp. FD36]